jgi:drug/metabolite transporter (DMT)-like permease
VLASVFLGERLDAARVAALAVASVGLALTIGGGTGTPLGIALALGAALIYAVYIVVGTRLLRDLDALAASSLICAAAAASFAVLATVNAAAGGWLPVVGLALVSTALAIAAFFAGLRRLGATLTSVISTLEPVVSVVLAASVLGERIGALQALGGAIVVGTAAWLALRPSRRR